jgi:hypothetical protein
MKGLFKAAVAVALVVMAWNVLVPSCSAPFGCEALGAAHADDETCPTSIEGAVGDSAWAASRYETIKDRAETVGLAYDEDGTEHEFTSGEDDDADKAALLLRDRGVPAAKDGSYPVASHVEIKVAARMHDDDTKKVVLVINNRRGVCSYDVAQGGLGCQQALPYVLPDGAEIFVWDVATQVFQRFVGK